MHVLIIGDFHVPDRSRELPFDLIKSLNTELDTQPFDFIACTGDLTKADMIEPIIATWCDKYVVVQGNMDYDLRNAKAFPRAAEFDTGDFIPDREPLKLGLTHGHQIARRGDEFELAAIARELDANVLISGHTHAPEIRLHEEPIDGRQALLLNPGSATGAWSFMASMFPSYMVLDIEPDDEGLVLHIALHEIPEGEESVKSITFRYANGTFRA
jgi:putative phosphoesterase